MARLFGTDGIRGVANDDLTPELAFTVGRAAAHVLAPAGGAIVIGSDTRVSGPMLEAAVAAAFCSAGVRVLRAGILPTPAVAYLIPVLGASAGVMISASHNPIEDNGIKFFGPAGRKLNDGDEDRIEAAMQATADRPVGKAIGSIERIEDSQGRYLDHLVAASTGAEGLRVVVDCAYGAAYHLAPALWSRLGAEVIALHAEPDGERINVDCGSTAPARAQEAVRRHRAHLGLAHDGDADRVIAIDERGALVDGDLIMTLCARHLAHRGELVPRRIVATVMTNLGVERALLEEGIEMDRACVGDRYVLDEMEAGGAVLGGEQSGHIIFSRWGATGDGLMTAVHLVNALIAAGRSLSALVGGVHRIPQVLLNVRVGCREEAMKHAGVVAAIRDTDDRMRGRGRLLVRPSGTEPLIRVMVEHEDRETAESAAQGLAERIRELSGDR
ncbi:MAG: phosphoglucosamine mutase [Armatimonadetes bacterium]|nr:phosphoglucosamine mutase [Armatimonadota bacterium]